MEPPKPMTPRTYLFVPADRPDRIGKALASQADAIIVDLEDGVAPAHKALARETVAQLRPHKEKPVLVRCNAVSTPEFQEDVDCLRAAAPALAAVMPAKCESALEMEILAKALPGLPVLPLIETVAGIAAVPDLARMGGIEKVAFGSVDFANNLGVTWSPSGQERQHAMGQLVFASRLHGLLPPVDAVFPALDNPDAFEADIQRGKQMGFFGKLIIHPNQIEPVHRIYDPSEEQIAWARKVVTLYEKDGGRGAVLLDGQLVDRPVYERARSVLHLDAP